MLAVSTNNISTDKIRRHSIQIMSCANCIICLTFHIFLSMIWKHRYIINRYLGIIGSVRPTMRELVTSGPEVTNCANMNFLSEVQRKLCGQERRLPKVISDGASLGIGECKHQFGNRRWNCSTYNSTDVFGGILKQSK
jgi:hypothetical protein